MADSLSNGNLVIVTGFNYILEKLISTVRPRGLYRSQLGRSDHRRKNKSHLRLTRDGQCIDGEQRPNNRQ